MEEVKHQACTGRMANEHVAWRNIRNKRWEMKNRKMVAREQ